MLVSMADLMPGSAVAWMLVLAGLMLGFGNFDDAAGFGRFDAHAGFGGFDAGFGGLCDFGGHNAALAPIGAGRSPLGRLAVVIRSDMPTKPPAPSEPADYRRWKAHAAALLLRLGIPEGPWSRERDLRQLYIRGATPEQAAEQVQLRRSSACASDEWVARADGCLVALPGWGWVPLSCLRCSLPRLPRRARITFSRRPPATISTNCKSSKAPCRSAQAAVRKMPVGHYRLELAVGVYAETIDVYHGVGRRVSSLTSLHVQIAPRRPARIEHEAQARCEQVPGDYMWSHEYMNSSLWFTSGMALSHPAHINELKLKRSA
jgi:hypothetical protein